MEGLELSDGTVKLDIFQHLKWEFKTKKKTANVTIV